MKYAIIIFIFLFLITMPLQNWEGLQKSTTDDETIEQAIARLIAVHESDAESHLGANESLAAHKAADVIDHPAGSVVSDKIPDGQLLLSQYSISRYVTQIDIGDMAVNNFDGSGWGGSLYAELATENQWYTAYSGGDELYNLLGVASKSPTFRIRLRPNRTTNAETYFGIGDFLGDSALGFKIVNSTLYSVWWDNNPTEHLDSIAGISVSVPHNYEVRVTYNTKIEWFVDGVSVKSITFSGSPQVLGGNIGLTISLRKTNTTVFVVVLYQFLFEQEFI